MIRITLTEENLRDLVAGKIVSLFPDCNIDLRDTSIEAQITVRELPVDEIFLAVAEGLRDLAKGAAE